MAGAPVEVERRTNWIWALDVAALITCERAQLVVQTHATYTDHTLLSLSVFAVAAFPVLSVLRDHEHDHDPHRCPVDPSDVLSTT